MYTNPRNWVNECGCMYFFRGVVSLYIKISSTCTKQRDCRVHSMECDDLIAECVKFENECTNKFDNCNNLFDQGMVFAAHQLMLKNIDSCVDLGGRQSELYEAIKREHTFVFEKRQKMQTAFNWINSSSSEKGKGFDDAVKISTGRDNPNDFLMHTQLDAGTAQCTALASRLEFASEWIDAVSSSDFVCRISAHSHIACLTVANPIWRMFGGNVLYVRVDCYNNILFDSQYIVIIRPLNAQDADKYNISGAKSSSIFLSFSAITFVFSTNCGMTGPALAHTSANVKILVEQMQMMRYTPSYINNMACVDFFAKLCRHWANTARQLGDMLYDGDRLSKLVAFVEKQALLAE